MLLAFLISLLGGLVAGTFGSGGQAIMVALLTLSGTPQHLAQALVLIAALPPVSLPSALTLRRVVKVDWWRVVHLAVGLVAGTALGAWIANRLDVTILAFGFGLVIAALGLRTLGQVATRTLRQPQATGARAWNAQWIGGVAGTASGMFGISGGVVSIPLMRRVFGASQLETQATQIWAVLPPLALPGALIYLQQRPDFPWAMAGLMALGLVPGMAIGTRLAVKLPTDRLRGGFGVVQILLGAAVIARTAGWLR